MESFDESDNIVEFTFFTTEEEVTTIDAFDRFICWYLDNLERIYLIELFFFCFCCTSHSREFFI